jgi:phage FluMu protein Com
MDQENINEYRCDCGKLLFKGSVFVGSIEIKCRKCNRIFCVEEGEMPIPKNFVVLINSEGLVQRFGPL